MTQQSAPPPDRFALLSALGAHAFWGSMPLYLLLVRTVPPVEFVAWRIVFTLPLCAAALFWGDGIAELRSVLTDRRALLTLLASAIMVGLNWVIYVWAIQAGHIYAASIGYYILPLIMMLFGLVLLGERVTRRQWAAIALAGCGVAALAAGALTTLWVSLSLAVCFAIYGVLRKTVAAGSLVGLTIETLILLPVSLGVVFWYADLPAGSALAQGWKAGLVLALGGPMTAIPMLLFAFAARRLPYSLMGFLQFTSPTIVFVIGLTVFGAELHPAQLAAFVLIWAAVVLFVLDQLRGRAIRRADASQSAALRGTE